MLKKQNLDELKSYRYDEKEPKEEKEKTFKWLFIKRFAKEGRMTHAAFEAWKNLKFDPVKDDVEEFMTTIKNLASTLAFNEEAQVMAIKVICQETSMDCVCNIRN